MTKTDKVEKSTEVKVAESVKKKSPLDLSKVLENARKDFSKNEQGLAEQISTGSQISRPTKDSDFVLYPGEHWLQLTGIKGIPFGRIVQIAGKPDSGKSSHAMAFMKEAQDKGYQVILWDAENKFSAIRFDNYFKGNSKDLLIVTNKMILEGGDLVISLIRAVFKQDSTQKVLFVWDSVGGTLSSAEDVKNLRDSRQMAMAAKENGQAIHSFMNLMEQFKDKETNEERIAVLLINQTYANIGSVGQKESGGQKVEFHSSLILQLTRKGDLNKVKDGIKRKTGIVTRAKVKKNHLFDGEDSIAELDLEVKAGSIAAVGKLKASEDGWDEEEEEK